MKNISGNIFPENIRCIAVTAPAGYAAPERLSPAVNKLEKMVKVKSFVALKTPETASYLAGGADDRLRLFNAAVNDPEVDMVLAVRGGFGSVHILQGIDYAALRRRNLPVMGYSDITALHCAMLKNNAGIPIAGSNLLDLDKVFDDELSFISHKLALSNSFEPTILPADKLKSLNHLAENTTVSALAYAANLTVLTSLCGTDFMPDFSNKILIIEDVNEPVYKIDRMLEQLRYSGVLIGLAALVFGKFTNQENDYKELEKLFADKAQTLTCPVYKNFSFGHEFPMCAVNSSCRMTIKNGHSPLVSLTD